MDAVLREAVKWLAPDGLDDIALEGLAEVAETLVNVAASFRAHVETLRRAPGPGDGGAPGARHAARKRGRDDGDGDGWPGAGGGDAPPAKRQRRCPFPPPAPRSS